jgi:hypothetical protein
LSAGDGGDAGAGWPLLERELDRWDAHGRRATLWWRDDDACRDSPALHRLLGLAHAQRVPVAVAAVPAAAQPSLVAAIERCPEATVLQHGYAHCNHAGAGERSAEFGSVRPLPARLDELARGRRTLAGMFGTRFTPVLVPPWNRIGDDLVPHLPAAGACGLSTFGPRQAALAAPGLPRVNVHVDLIAWRRGRCFIGPDAAIERIAAHLRARRTGAADDAEPTGVLSHHLVSDEATFDFLAELFVRTRRRNAAAWIGVADAFAGDTPISVRSA